MIIHCLTVFPSFSLSLYHFADKKMDKLNSSVSLRHGAELHYSKRNSKEEVWLRELQFLPRFLLVPAREVSYFGICAARLKLTSPLMLTSLNLQNRKKRDKGLCQKQGVTNLGKGVLLPLTPQLSKWDRNHSSPVWGFTVNSHLVATCLYCLASHFAEIYMAAYLVRQYLGWCQEQCINYWTALYCCFFFFYTDCYIMLLFLLYFWTFSFDKM